MTFFTVVIRGLIRGMGRVLDEQHRPAEGDGKQ